MDYNIFNYTLDMGHPPDDFQDTLKALWWDRKGEWNKAHELVQYMDGQEAAWVHAYLHRKEGDAANAAYWYERAGKTIPVQDLNEEFRTILDELLSKADS